MENPNHQQVHLSLEPKYVGGSTPHSVLITFTFFFLCPPFSAENNNFVSRTFSPTVYRRKYIELVQSTGMLVLMDAQNQILMSV